MRRFAVKLLYFASSSGSPWMPASSRPSSSADRKPSWYSSPSGSFSRLRADRFGDGRTQVAGARLALHVGRVRTLDDHALDRAHDVGRRLGMAEVLEHQRPRPDGGERIGDL